MIDFNHGSGFSFSNGGRATTTIASALNDLIDEGLKRKNDAQTPRTYVSASGIGRACLRQVQYDYLAVPRDPGRDFDGATLRRFLSGHALEPVVADLLRGAGFTLATAKADFSQYGFADVVIDGVARWRGHIDGVLVAGPPIIAFPALWENKAMGRKTWQKVSRQGVAVANPVYASQIATYQAYLGLADNPALFTALNRDTWDLYVEMIPFDPALAQRDTDRAVSVIQSSEAKALMPRVASSREYFECRMCGWQDRCWISRG